MEFRYYMPVKTFFGRNCIEKNSGEFLLLGKKALIVTGKSSAEKNGSLADVKRILGKVKIPYAHYNRIKPNPSVENVREAALFAKESGADFIIGIGGGSPLDAAKAIAVLAVNDIDDDTLFGGVYSRKPLPVAAIPTTAGTGSEVTPYSILTYNKISNKKSIGSDAIFPAAAFLDPAYTTTLSSETTVNTAVDALSHAIEGYLSAKATDVINPYAIESIRLIGECIPELKADKIKDEVREKLLYASMLAGIVIAHAGTTAVHAMGYPLTYHRNIDHGRANGLLLYHYLKFLEPSIIKVKHITDAIGMKNVDEFGKSIEKLLGEKEIITEEELVLFTKTAMAAKNISNTVPQPEEKDVRKIFEDSFKR
ncbi:MAG TPA: iron-containing alcohol dehydrogenase family protein [Spirochaetota bacterium]|nr:iron-containing alcohol dehydrogenase family protein [Spirochaetota bacterium]HPS87261.1 iron-containing alcohol dehydrogenase family protein [Spirochaetota bacterium]